MTTEIPEDARSVPTTTESTQTDNVSDARSKLSMLEDVLTSSHDDEMSERTALTLLRDAQESLEAAEESSSYEFEGIVVNTDALVLDDGEEIVTAPKQLRHDLDLGESARLEVAVTETDFEIETIEDGGSR